MAFRTTPDPTVTTKCPDDTAYVRESIDGGGRRHSKSERRIQAFPRIAGGNSSTADPLLGYDFDRVIGIEHRGFHALPHEKRARRILDDGDDPS